MGSTLTHSAASGRTGRTCGNSSLLPDKCGQSLLHPPWAAGTHLAAGALPPKPSPQDLGSETPVLLLGGPLPTGSHSALSGRQRLQLEPPQPIPTATFSTSHSCSRWLSPKQKMMKGGACAAPPPNLTTPLLPSATLRDSFTCVTRSGDDAALRSFTS